MDFPPYKLFVAITVLDTQSRLFRPSAVHTVGIERISGTDHTGVRTGKKGRLFQGFPGKVVSNRVILGTAKGLANR
jgi:hypothetical protein